jgi:hypothetical protein
MALTLRIPESRIIINTPLEKIKQTINNYIPDIMGPLELFYEICIAPDN